jgi:N utilization substance protein A
LDEVAYVEIHELSDIEGFDGDTAVELQTRAREYLEAAESANEAKRTELGVTDELAGIEGITSAMLVAFGENEVKNMEDLAGCAADDLTGWFEVVDGERKKMDGILEGFDIAADEANDLIMYARVQVGWVTEEDLAADAAEEEAIEEAEGEKAEEGSEKASAPVSDEVTAESVFAPRPDA